MAPSGAVDIPAWIAAGDISGNGIRAGLFEEGRHYIQTFEFADLFRSDRAQEVDGAQGRVVPGDHQRQQNQELKTTAFELCVSPKCSIVDC